MNQREFLDHINENKGILIKISKLYASSRQDQEDLRQEIVYQLWKSIDSFKGESKFSTWLYRVALNTAIKSFKKEKKRADHQVVKANGIVQADTYDSTKDKQIELFYRAVKKINEVERAILFLYIEGFSGREIAQQIGISEGAVRVKINRIKKKITIIIKEMNHEF